MPPKGGTPLSPPTFAGYLNVNNIRVDGARGCSILKSTKYYNVVRNSRLSALVDPEQPGMGRRADKLIEAAHYLDAFDITAHVGPGRFRYADGADRRA